MYAYTCMRRGRQCVDFRKCQVIFGKDFCWCRLLFEREVCQLQVSLILLTMLVCSNVHLCVWMCVCRERGVVRACVCACYSVKDAQGGKHAHALSSLLFRSLYLNTRMLFFSSSLFLSIDRSLSRSGFLSLSISPSLSLWHSISLPFYLCPYPCLYLCICLYIFLCLCLSRFLFVSLSVSLSVFVCVCVCVCIYVSMWICIVSICLWLQGGVES